MKNAIAADHARLRSIGASFYSGAIDRPRFLSEVITLIIERLGCSRVSLWRFDGPPDALAMLCFAAKHADGPLTAKHTLLLEPEFGDYFDALRQNGTYASDDAKHDPHLAAMRRSYLVPNGIVSMVDAAFTVNGRVYGAVCCEQTDALRTWQPDEITALRSIVGRIALLMAGAGDRALWSSPSIPLSDES